MIAHARGNGVCFAGVKPNVATIVVAVLVGAMVGLVSSFVPAYNASRGNIVEGLRHIG
jgi:ABC-type antimicrobial peptide transport system permease subunit